MTGFLFLIIAPDVKIMDESDHELRDRYYKIGSSISLSCKVRSSSPIFDMPHPVWSKTGFNLSKNIKISLTNW